MKVIFDNLIFSLQKSGGITTFWLELIKRAGGDSAIDALFSEPHGQCQNNSRLVLPITVDFFERRTPRWLSFCNFTVPIEEKAIFHSSYYRTSTSRKAINVVTIYDFTAEYYFTGIRRYRHLRRKKNALLHGDGFVCISNHTKRDLLKLYPFVDEEKIRVIYCGISDDYFVIPETECVPDYPYANLMTDKTVLYVGSRAEYKNFTIAAEAVSQLPKEYIFLIIGEQLSKHEKLYLDKILKNRYICLSGIDNKTLNIFYNSAYCLLYPSAYEGFGIPPLEAMKAGCPVITTNRSSLPEVTGDAAIAIDEINPARFAEAVLMLSDEPFRNRLIEKGLRQSSHFSWDKCYEEIKRFYMELYNQAP